MRGCKAAGAVGRGRSPNSGKRHHADARPGGWQRLGCRLSAAQLTFASQLLRQTPGMAAYARHEGLESTLCRPCTYLMTGKQLFNVDTRGNHVRLREALLKVRACPNRKDPDRPQ